jgi:hypothetical protein
VWTTSLSRCDRVESDVYLACVGTWWEAIWLHRRPPTARKRHHSANKNTHRGFLYPIRSFSYAVDRQAWSWTVTGVWTRYNLWHDMTWSPYDAPSLKLLHPIALRTPNHFTPHYTTPQDMTLQHIQTISHQRTRKRNQIKWTWFDADNTAVHPRKMHLNQLLVWNLGLTDLTIGGIHCFRYTQVKFQTMDWKLTTCVTDQSWLLVLRSQALSFLSTEFQASHKWGCRYEV